MRLAAPVLAALLLLPAAVLAAPAAHAQGAAAETIAPDGSHAVVVAAEVVLHDAARNSDLPVIVVHPEFAAERAATYPVIVFSHGLGGQGSQVLTLPKHWASHGFIVLVPTYRDSLRHQLGQGRAMGGMRTLLDRVRGDTADFQYRPADCSFLLAALDALIEKVPALRDRMDRGRVGAGGHSLGAYTTALVGGTKIDLPDGTDRASVRDDRVQALLMLSPQGAGPLGLTHLSWNDVRIPMMSVTGSKDGGAGGQSPEWRKEPYARAPSGGKYHLFVQGADHGFFTTPPDAKAEKKFQREKQRAAGRKSPDPQPQSGVLTKLLGDPATQVADMDALARRQLQARLARVVETGTGGARTQGALFGRLQHLLTMLRDEQWASADLLRAELLAGSTTTSGETIAPEVKFALVKLVTRLFWDAHLKGDSGAASALRTGATLAPAAGTVTLDRK